MISSKSHVYLFLDAGNSSICLWLGLVWGLLTGLCFFVCSKGAWKWVLKANREPACLVFDVDSACLLLGS